MGAVVLYAVDGTPLLRWVDSPEGYRRNAMGFRIGPPEDQPAREITNEPLDRVADERPPCCHCADHPDAEGEELEIPEEEEEEGVE